MRWRSGRRSANVEDRRRVSPRGKMAVGGGLGTIVFVLIAILLGADPGKIMQLLGNAPGRAPAQGQQQQQEQQPLNPAEEELKEFVSVVLADTEDVWKNIFKQSGDRYREPKLVLFSGDVKSACGFASAAMGPFYCPADEKVYIDLSFYQDLKSRHGAPGDFAQAYVIAHEVGHHVQNLRGITKKVHQLKGRVSEAKYNQYSVRLELQADFFAGVWAHHAQRQRKILEEGDIEEALNAASAIGDDRLQQQGRGYVVPESFTHGTSEQRVRWFRKGFHTGDLSQGDTFNAKEL